jgi:hypothetical protein
VRASLSCYNNYAQMAGDAEKRAVIKKALTGALDGYGAAYVRKRHDAAQFAAAMRAKLLKPAEEPTAAEAAATEAAARAAARAAGAVEAAKQRRTAGATLLQEARKEAKQRAAADARQKLPQLGLRSSLTSGDDPRARPSRRMSVLSEFLGAHSDPPSAREPGGSEGPEGNHAVVEAVVTGASPTSPHAAPSVDSASTDGEADFIDGARRALSLLRGQLRWVHETLPARQETVCSECSTCRLRCTR